MVTLNRGDVIEAYLKIHPPKEAPGKPREESPYLEDVLFLREKLLNGQTIEQCLKDVTARPDGAHHFKQSLHEAAEEILSKTDLFQQPFVLPFLRAALEGFGELIQTQSSMTSKLHPSWFKDALLHKTISEKAPLPYINRLLELGLEVTVTDTERRTTLRSALDQGGDADLLSLLISFCPKDQLHSWINATASDHLTALDIALETQHSAAVKTLIESSAFLCHPNIALKFYRNVIKATQDNSLKTSFLKLMNINDEIRWHVCLEEMLPPYNSEAKSNTTPIDQQGISIATAKFGKRFLPQKIKDQILDDQNQWIPYTQEGNHLVCRATWKNETLNIEHSLYFKVFPELPGIEEAVGLLTRKLLNYGAPHTELLNIAGCPVLVSHSHGDKDKTLDFMLRNHPHTLNNLDEMSLSGLILVAMLINPEDGKPTNYVIEPHPSSPKKYCIVGIDNDHAFVPAIVAEKPKKGFWDGKLIPIAQVKTVLYCLDQMKDPIHPTIRSLFINLRPDEVLDEWLRELKKVNTSYSDFFPNPKDHVTFFKEHECFLGIPFQKGAISHLYDKFVTLRDLLTKNQNLTHLDLLSKLEQRLAKRYQLVSHLPTVKERWEAGDALFYEKTHTGSGTTLTRSGDILRSMNLPLEESVLESIRRGKALGPIQALEELKNSKNVLQIKTLEALGARAGDHNILKTLQGEATRASFLEKIDFKDLSPQEQEAVLSYLKNKPLENLPLKNCNALTDQILAQTLEVSHIKKLDLRGCEHITYRSLLHLSKTAPNLEELNLSNIKSLTAIGDLGNIYDDPLLFNTLRFLNLSNCTNLTKLLIKAPKLYYLNLENCTKLTDHMLDGVTQHTKNLTKLSLKGATKISVKELREKLPIYPSTILSMFPSTVSMCPSTFPTERFLKGKLIYRPTEGSDIGMIELPISALENPLEGTFDLSQCGEAGKHLSISTGYRKRVRAENENKLEIWLAPRFLIERNLNTTAGHYKNIMGQWNENNCPVAIFFNDGDWSKLIYYDYNVKQNFDEINELNLYKIWTCALPTIPTEAYPKNATKGTHSQGSRFMFVLN